MRRAILPLTTLVVFLDALAACSSDGPTAPREPAFSFITSALVASPSAATAGTGDPIRLTLTVREMLGRAVTVPHTVSIVAQRGTVGPITRQDDSTYVTFLIVSTIAGDDTITARVEGQEITRRAVVRVDPAPPVLSATRIILADPELLADGRSWTTTLTRLSDQYGNGLPGMFPSVTATGGTLGDVQYIGDGYYRAALRSSMDTGNVVVTVSVAGVEAGSATVRFIRNDHVRLRADLPTARRGAGAAAVDGAVYVVGGELTPYIYDDGAPTNVLEVYDPAVDSWSSGAPMPTARSWAATVALNGKVYVIGGNNGPVLSTVEVYDPALDSWTTTAPMPTPRSSLAVAALNGLIYALGGDGTGAMHAYDPASDRWTSVAPLPLALMDFALVAAAGKLYAIGGWDMNEYDESDAVYAYDPATNSWSIRASLPEPRHGFGAGYVAGRIFVIGGSQEWTSSCRAYDPALDRWDSCPPVSSRRGYAASAVVNGSMYLMGGFELTFEGSAGNAKTVEEYHP